jgi:parallel beta-helix repeat protein
MEKKLFGKGLIVGIIVILIVILIGASIGSSINVSLINNRSNSLSSEWPYPPDIIVPDDYPTIQQAIDNASQGSYIGVRNGTYNENLNIWKSLNIMGEDKNTTIIDSGVGNGVYVSADLVNINGFMIQNSSENAIFLDSCNHTTIVSNVIRDSNFAIKLVDSNNNQIRDCQIFNNIWGINIASNIGASTKNNIITNCQIFNNALLGLHIWSSSNNTIQNNTFISDSIAIIGSLEDCYQNIDTTNTVNGKPVYYFYNEKDTIIDNWDIGELILVNCTGFLIKNIEISGTDVGLEAIYSSNNTISNCDFSNNLFGLELFISSYNIIENNTANNNTGFLIGTGGWPSTGISVAYGSHNIIRNNNASNNYIGIFTFYSTGNTIEGNNITSNTIYGIAIQNSSDNTVYHNNFIRNTQNAYDNGANTWDDGKKGNYWDDYEEKYPDAHKKWWKGIWDTPYEIPGGDNTDSYPLIKQWPSTLSVSIPTIKIFNFNFILLQQLIERFPNAFPLLRHILKY